MNNKQRAYRVWQWGFYPLMITGALTICIFLLDYLSPQYWQFIPLSITLLCLIPINLLEKTMPYLKTWQGYHSDLALDLWRTFLIFPLASLMAQYTLKFFQPYISINLFPGSDSIHQSPVALVIQFVGILLLIDLFYYWVHRAFHHFKVLWYFHAIHHRSQRVYSNNSGRFHFIEVFISGTIYFLPIYIFNIPENIITAIVTTTVITGFLEHVNIDFKAGKLNYVLNTAELHRWHHSLDVHESNHNFGKVLSIWDRCFGTFYFPSDKEIKNVGIEE
ncbi:MAG: sterol desaturase family protein [Bacteroidia bacterium]|jgi:sterol desaturase/sphingolipid hydroxylase (fatty acid hydroxylase superfamily)